MKANKVLSGLSNRGGRFMKVATTVGVLAVGAGAALAQSSSPDPTSIVTSATTIFTAAATLCVTIGTFYVGYRLAKRIR
jgi:hypothetical protein